jgi:hypothetical protein
VKIGANEAHGPENSGRRTLSLDGYRPPGEKHPRMRRKVKCLAAPQGFEPR